MTKRLHRMRKRPSIIFETIGELVVAGVGAVLAAYWELAPVITSVVVVGIVALGWWWFTRKERLKASRLRAGQCEKCGYDLRATPDPVPGVRIRSADRANNPTESDCRTPL